MAQTRELSGLQGLRATACLMVVGYHALWAGAGETAAVAWPNGSAGVDLFFVISGFVMVRSSRGLLGRKNGWASFIARRLIRIVPLDWLLTTIKLAVALATPGLAAHTRPDSWNVLASYLFIPARDAAGVVRPVLPIGWTLEFEMLFYALFALALACRIRPLILLTPLLAVVAGAGFFRQAAWPAPMMLANGMVLEFCAGMLLADRALPARWAPGVALVSAAALLVLPLAGPWRFLVWGVPATGLVAATLALEPMLRQLLPAWVTRIGDASYAVYLVHPFVIGGLAFVSPWLTLAALPVSAAVGLLVHTRIDMRLQARLRRATSPASLSSDIPPPIAPSPAPDGWTGAFPPAPARRS